MKTVLTIAGSDCSGGAGIQADIKTITAHKMYAMSAITALTAQNTLGVYGIHNVDSDFVGNQLDCIFKDIFPDAVKIGMVSEESIIKIIAQKLIEYQAKNIVLDPVMVSTSGSTLLSPDAISALKEYLMPLATLITPNIPEAEVLSKIKITKDIDMIVAAKLISKFYQGAILIKGGHNINNANDLLLINDNHIWIRGERVETKNTHGTGCTLSSSIACNIASGYSIEEAIIRAKNYITGCLKDGLDLGKGSGPLNHCYNIKD